MPTVIIPPTDVSPNTGTGSEVLSTSPNLLTPTLSVGAVTTALTDLLINPTTKASGNLIDAQVNSVSKFSVTSAGAGTFGGNLTVSGTDVKINNAAGYFYVDSGSSATGMALSRTNNILELLTANNVRLTISAAGNTTLAGNLTVSGTGTSAFSGQISSTSAATASGDLRLSHSAGGKVIRWASANYNVDLYQSGDNDILRTRVANFQISSDPTFASNFTTIAAGNITTTGNLTVSGTGVNTFNVGAGTSVVSLNSTAATPTWISMTSGATTLGSIARTGNDLVISGGNSGAALTLTYGATQTATITGNLTVSGTGTSSFAGVAQFAATKGVTFNSSTDVGTYGIGFKNDGSVYPIRVALANDAVTQRRFQVGYYSTDTQAGTWTNSFEVNGYNGNTTLSGNLTVSGTGTSGIGGNLVVGGGSLAGSERLMVRRATTGYTIIATDGTHSFSIYNGGGAAWIGTSSNHPLDFFTNGSASQARLATSGNFLIGGTIDSSNGNLQLKDTSGSSTKGIGFGTDTSLYRAAQSIVAIDGLSTAYAKLRLYESSVLKVQLESAGGDFTLATLTAGKSLKFNSGNDTLALTLDSSQNATFAGNIKTAAPSGGTAATWRLGTVASVSPTSPNRTIEVEIGGTTYYIHAKTTND